MDDIPKSGAYQVKSSNSAWSFKTVVKSSNSAWSFETVEDSDSFKSKWAALNTKGAQAVKKPAAAAEKAAAEKEAVKKGAAAGHRLPTQQLQFRLADVQDEPLQILGPIVGVMKAPRLSLQEAAVATGVEDVDLHAFLAAEQAAQIVAQDSLNLSVDEVGSINLYTMQSELYPTLNKLLRQRDRQKLKPFFPYLQLMLRARQRLPPYIGSVWRGVKGVDLREKYPKGKEFYWWAFSSTTKQLETLTSPQFLGKKGVRTVFMIEVRTGIDIERFSAFQDEASEAEVLLYPGTKLQVVGSIDMDHDLFQVHLREVEVPKELMK